MVLIRSSVDDGCRKIILCFIYSTYIASVSLMVIQSHSGSSRTISLSVDESLLLSSQSLPSSPQPKNDSLYQPSLNNI